MPQFEKIQLTQRKYTIIDTNMFDYLNQWKWYYHLGYAIRGDYSTGKRINIRMHRLIINPPHDMDIDHINGDKLDNRRKNLRLATSSQNLANMKKIIKGIQRTKWNNNDRWRARIKVNYKSISLGCFATKLEAIKAYNEAAKRYFGEFARLNNIGGIFCHN